MPEFAFRYKLPSELSEQGVAEARLFMRGGLGPMRYWANHILERLTPEQAIEELRQTSGSLWPKIMRWIVLSAHLIEQDEPPYEEYEHLIPEWEAMGEASAMEIEYIGQHIGPPHVSSLGVLFDVTTYEERVRAIERCHPKKASLVAHVANFLANWRPELLLTYLPAIERGLWMGRSHWAVILWRSTSRSAMRPRIELRGSPPILSPVFSPFASCTK